MFKSLLVVGFLSLLAVIGLRASGGSSHHAGKSHGSGSGVKDLGLEEVVVREGSGEDKIAVLDVSGVISSEPWDHRGKPLAESIVSARRGLSPRVDSLERNGCTITMGSDNMAEDMVEVMRTGMFMERIRREDGRNPTPELALRLKPGGYVHMATDWEPYALQMLEVLGHEPLLRNTSTHESGWAEKPHYRPLTKFEQRGLRLGHGVWDLVFQRA